MTKVTKKLFLELSIFLVSTMVGLGSPVQPGKGNAMANVRELHKEIMTETREALRVTRGLERSLLERTNDYSYSDLFEQASILKSALNDYSACGTWVDWPVEDLDSALLAISRSETTAEVYDRLSDVGTALEYLSSNLSWHLGVK